MKKISPNTKKTEKLNWFTLTKKYWKEQLVFYLLTTISFLGSWFTAENSLNFAYDIIKKKEWEKLSNLKYKLTWGGKIVHNFGTNINLFLVVIAAIILIYCLIVVAHVYYCYYLNNKIIRDLKKRLFIKNFRLKNSADKKKFLNVLVHDTRSFADWVIFAPNQIYYVLLEIFLAFWLVRNAPEGAKVSILLLGVSYFLIILAVSGFFNFLLYKKDLIFQKKLEMQTQQENLAVNSRELIIKKGLEKDFFVKYSHILENTRQVANQEDWIYTLNFVVPSYSLIKYSEYIFYPFINSSQGWIAFNHLTKLFKNFKVIIARLREYPYYFSAKKRINYLLDQEERDDIQKNLKVNETITKITLKKLTFAYKQDNLILQNLNLTFEKGKVNRLEGANGFGKSTIISLIMGLYQPVKGEILINNKYKLSEINLNEWRNKISYAEHQNLVENGLSTGQKQLIELENLFQTDAEKEIFIFDEADNALDESNKKEFRERIENISKKKLVILISH